MAKKSKPAKKEKAPARPSRPKGRTEPVYTVMTFITFVAMAVGCALLYLDFEDYGKNPVPKENPPALPKLGGGGAAAPAPGTT